MIIFLACLTLSYRVISSPNPEKTQCTYAWNHESQGKIITSYEISRHLGLLGAPSPVTHRVEKAKVKSVAIFKALTSIESHYKHGINMVQL